MQVVVDGLLTNYEISGKGKIILFLHGWGDNLETFRQLVQKLSNNYRVVSLDLPGFGKTETPNDSYDLEKFSMFVKNFLVKTSNDQIYAIIGHSNGGAIAIKGTSNNIIECSKLVLLASSGIRNQNNNTKKLTRIIFKIAKQFTKILPIHLQDKLKRKAYKTVGSEMFVAENMQETFKSVVSEDLVEQADKISADTMLIYGSKDEATPVEYGKLLNSKIKYSKLNIISGAGHFVHHDEPEEVENIIKTFLEKS